MPDFNRSITALECIQRAMGQLGLTVPTTVIGNASDLMVSQFLALLNQAGLDLIEDPFKWQRLLKTFTINTAPATTQYPLPDDWAGFYSESSWNQSSSTPVSGPNSPQIWRMLKARNLGSNTFILQYILKGGFLELYASPSTTQTLLIDYMSRGWVQDATVSTTYRDKVVNDADVILFNPSLIVAKLKLKWREAKGFDSTSAKMDYDETYERAKATDAPGETLSLNPGNDFPYLGYYNIPDTGYGS